MYHSPEIVVGYHGCDLAVAEKVLSGAAGLNASENEYDWLGNGIYFWEGSHDKALAWAKESKKINEPAVIGAFIRLGNCLDLLDVEHVKEVQKTYANIKDEYAFLEKDLPSNSGKKEDGIRYVRKLDCLVIQRLHQFNNEAIAQKLHITSKDHKAIQNDSDFIDSVRGLFQEENELYKDSGFRKGNHIQLCIKNPNCIVGYFRPQNPSGQYKKF